jgi:O-antigen/teichoic acid export membrane protein
VVFNQYEAKHRSRTRPGGIFHQNIDVLLRSGSLVGTTVVTSALGFLYWLVAAHAFDASTVGAASVATSALSLLGSLGMLGFGTLLITELSRSARRALPLVSAGLLLAGTASAVLAVAYVCVAPLISPELLAGRHAVLTVVMLVVGVSVTAVGLVLDQALIGLVLGKLQMWRNTYFAGVKLALLAGLGLVPFAANAGGILATWVAGLFASFALLVPHLRARGIRLLSRPRPAALRTVGRAAMGHNVLNLATTVPRIGLPLVVAATLSVSTNAAFFAAWMVAGFLYMVPTHLSTSLFAVASGDLESLRNKLRFTLVLTLGLGLPASWLLAVLARPAMTVFGSDYAATASGCLTILALSYVPVAIKQLYVAVCRVTGHLREASVVATIGAVAELLAAWFGARHGGVLGVAQGLAAVSIVEAFVMAPRVFGAALRRLRPVASATRFIGVHPVRARGVASVVTAIDHQGTVSVALGEQPQQVIPRQYVWFQTDTWQPSTTTTPVTGASAPSR